MSRTENRQTVGEKVEARERGRRQSKETTNTQTCDDMCMCDILSDTRCDTLSHNVICAQGQICRENVSCEVYVYTHRLLQWIAIDCKRNQL